LPIGTETRLILQSPLRVEWIVLVFSHRDLPSSRSHVSAKHNANAFLRATVTSAMTSPTLGCRLGLALNVEAKVREANLFPWLNVFVGEYAEERNVVIARVDVDGVDVGIWITAVILQLW
jgi:hypothetical protein